MKLEVGMIARTNKGLLIDIIHDFDSELCAYKRDEITKVSFNIINLIEVGDVLTINQFNNDYEKVEVYETFNIYTRKKELCVLSNGKPKRVTEVNIKSILTHELYENNTYKVVE